jgi:hypothetical protein
MTQAELAQAIEAPQAPPLPHVWTLLPEHCTAPGVQVPVQTPLTHAELVQAVAAPHWPLD